MFLFSHRSTSCSSLRGGEGCLDIKGPKREKRIGRVLLGVYVLKVILSRQGALFGQCALCVSDFRDLDMPGPQTLSFRKEDLFLARDKIDLQRKHFIPLETSRWLKCDTRCFF
jgi:hypothetical protein